MPVLVIQTGHVGRPPAPWSVGTAGEQDFTRRVGDSCMRLLHGRGGWTVRVIPADPGYPNPNTIGGNSDHYRGDAFVAVHCDGSTNPDRNGASFGYQSGGRAFAQDIKLAYLRRTGREASWLEPDNYTSNLAGYYGNNLATRVGNTRACIFEAGFLTNPQDRDMLLAPSGPDNVALAIGDALGITTPEDDMEPGDVWSAPLTKADGYKAPSAEFVIAASDRSKVAADNTNKILASLSQVAADVAALKARPQPTATLDEATREDLVARIVAARDTADASAVVDELAERLQKPSA